MFGFRKYPLPDGFFHGSYDIHCHLLPGVDDGFPSRERSFNALKKLEEQGVSKVILTPHFMTIYPDNTRDNIRAEFEDFKAEAEQISQIEFRLAGEYMLDKGFQDRFGEGFFSLDKTGRYVLCETSYKMFGPKYENMLYDIMCDDFQPVIAHPERYEYAGKRIYMSWKNKGYVFQLNLLSLAGAYGEPAKQKAHYLLDEGLYDYVGSDMHNLDSFRYFLPKLKLKVKDIDKVTQLMENNKRLYSM